MYYDNTAPYQGNNIIDLKRVIDLEGEPITLNEAKTQLRVTFDDDDIEIAKLLTKARKRVENYCNISIVPQRIQLIAYFNSDFQLPYGPVIAIEDVADSQGVTGSGPMTFATSTTNWQSAGDTFINPIGYNQRIVYQAGMADCPDDLKDAILQVLVFLYENRGKTGDVVQLEQVLRSADNYKKLDWI